MMLTAEGGLLAGLLIVTVLSSASGQTPQSYGSCTTVEDKTGLCIDLTECTEIYNLYNKPDKRSGDILYLKASQCGVSRRLVLVCCSADQIQAVEMPSPAKRECGRVLHDRIVGGTATKFDEYPWTALLEYERNGKSVGHKCGGSLINKRYVVTAGHCLDTRKPVRVRLGEWDLLTDIDCVTDSRNKKDCAEPHIDVGVESSIVHPKYSKWSRNLHFDIALIRLERNVEFTYFIQPICMPPESAISRDAIGGQFMNVAGWGKTENNTNSSKKLKLEIPIVSSTDCQEIYRKSKMNLISSQLCAGGVKGRDSCTGDSGGPLMAVDTVNNKQYTYLAGVVSFGPEKCGSENLPGVYTKVSELKNWIMENMSP